MLFFFLSKGILEDTSSYQQTRQVADVSEAMEERTIFPLIALKQLWSCGKVILLAKKMKL